MAKIIVLGMNRTGTKLASFLAAKHFNLKNIFLEPFTWGQSIDASISDNWDPQLKIRQRSSSAQIEHKNLSVISDKNSSSEWMEQLLCSESWDVYKFIEIGRAELIFRYASDASYILLIRDPVSYLESISGLPVAKAAVVEQAKRLAIEEGICDPLPGIDQYLEPDLADCARAYSILYEKLGKFCPPKSIRVSYESLLSDSSVLKKLATNDMPYQPYLNSPPRIGPSTKRAIPDNARKYISDTLGRVYQNFLK